MRAWVIPLLLLGLSAPAAPRRSHGAGPVSTAREAKAIAEAETGGQAVSARRTYLNGATCGWEVEVRMPREDRGWRCMIDCDTRAVHSRTRIPNPASAKHRR